MAVIEPFELYAIRYARHTGRSMAQNYMGGGDFHDDDTNLDYYIWVARRGQQTFVIDTGFGPGAAAARGRELFQEPATALNLLGIDAAQVTDIIITHLHYDHAGTLGAFPTARFHLQEAEAAYATGPCMCHDILRQPFDVEDVVEYVRTLFAGRVKFHNGVATLADGISIHRIGGHTAGLQVVRVWTKRGWVVLASDAVHLYGNMQRGVPFPVVHNVQEMLDGYGEVRRLAESEDHIIPGHDPLVMRKYPSPSAAMGDVVVCLDVLPKPLG